MVASHVIPEALPGMQPSLHYGITYSCPGECGPGTFHPIQKLTTDENIHTHHCQSRQLHRRVRWLRFTTRCCCWLCLQKLLLGWHDSLLFYFNYHPKDTFPLKTIIKTIQKQEQERRSVPQEPLMHWKKYRLYMLRIIKVLFKTPEHLKIKSIMYLCFSS